MNQLKTPPVNRTLLAAVLFIGAALRIFYLVEHRHSPFFEPAILDPGYYHEWALRIVGGEWLQSTPFYGLPLYPYALAVIYKIVGAKILFIKIFQQSLGLLSGVLVYLLALRLFKKQSIAIAALVFSCVYKPFLFHETMYGAEAFAVPLYTAALLLALRFWDETRVLRALYLGFAFGLSALTKAGILIFMSVFIVLYLLYHQDSSSRKLKSALCILTGALTCILPVTAHNWAASGDFVFLSAHGGVNFYIGNNSYATGIYQSPPGIRSNIEGQVADSRMIAEMNAGKRLNFSKISKYWSQQGWKFLKEHPVDALKLYGRKAFLFVNAQEISDVENLNYSKRFSLFLRYWPIDFFILFMFAVPGLLWGLGSMTLSYRLIIISWLAAYTFGVLLFFVNARYRLPILSALIPFAAFMLVRFYQDLRSRRWRRCGASILVMFLAASVSRLPLVRITDAVPLVNVGNIWMKKGDSLKAAESYQEAVRIDPEYAKAYNDLGVALRESGQWGPAKEAFQTAVQKDPRNAHAYNNLGLATEHEGNLHQALHYFRKALELQPNLAEAHNNVGMILAKQGDLSRAEQAFEKALMLKSQNPRALTNLGMIWYYRGEPERAKEYWLHAIRLDPNFPDAREALRRITRELK